ncbi:MAG: hypothetical protein HZA14_08050 [Nitrospirae bacterium]|nr:hypothetical protein [Nitrospirota bacterium]
MTYPVDVSGVTVGDCDYAGISREEMLAEGAREYVEEGIMFVKEYFTNKEIKSLMPGVEAIAVGKPVLYREESGKVGLMVKVTGYGAGEPDRGIKLPVERLGTKKQMWKAENFAYFNRNELYQWQYGGWLH